MSKDPHPVHIVLRNYHISMGDRYMADYYDMLITELEESEEAK